MEQKEEKLLMSDREIIVWYLNGKVVGCHKLHGMSDGNQREELAFKLGIKEYDNFKFIDVRDMTVRIDASQVKGGGEDNVFDGLTMAEYSSKKYKERFMWYFDYNKWINNGVE